MTVQKYADNVESNNNWINPDRALGIEDNFCAMTTVQGAAFDVSFPSFGFSQDPTSVHVYVKCGCTTVPPEQIEVKVWNGSSWIIVGYIEFEVPLFPACSSTKFHHADLSAIIDTKEKLETVKIRSVFNSSGGSGGFKFPREAWTAYMDALTIIATEGGVPPPSETRPYSGSLLNPGIFLKERSCLKKLYSRSGRWRSVRTLGSIHCFFTLAAEIQLLHDMAGR